MYSFQKINAYILFLFLENFKKIVMKKHNFLFSH